MFEEYEKIANKSIEDSIKSETHGSLEEAMLTVGKRRSSMPRYTCASRPWGPGEGQHQRAEGPELNGKCWVPVLTINQGKPPYQPPLSTYHPPRTLELLGKTQSPQSALSCPRSLPVLPM